MTTADQMLAPYAQVAQTFTILPLPAIADPDTSGIEVVTKEIGGVIHFTGQPGYTIPEGTKYHECGHAFHYSLRYKRPGTDWMERYWTFRQFPGTWQEAKAESDQMTGMAQWMYLPGESFAEAFRIAYMGFGSEKTMDYGKTINPQETYRFFRSLNDEVMPVAVDYPGAIWVPSPNYTGGRPGSISHTVEHWTVAPAQSALNTLTSPTSGVSSHYLVARDATVYQLVREKDRAWHAGSAYWNDRTIGIEHEGGPNQSFTTEQLEASAALHRNIYRRLGTLTAVGHRDVYNTECPGTLPIARLLEDYLAMGEITETRLREIIREETKPISDKLNPFTDFVPRIWLRRLFWGFDPLTRVRVVNPESSPPPADLA